MAETWRGRWVAVVGRRAEGRIPIVERLARELADAGHRVGGFVQRPCFQGHEIVGYDLARVVDGERVPLAREVTEPELCRWGFSEAAFARARDWAVRDVADFVFVEAGRLEAAERGHWATLSDAIEGPAVAVVSIRPTVLASVVLRLPDPSDALELPSTPAEVEEFTRRLMGASPKEDA